MNYLCLMPDFCATGYWDANGQPLDPAEVPITRGLKRLIEGWIAFYNINMDDNVDNDTVRLFTAIGYELMALLRKELPDCHLVYFDEAKCDRVVV